MYFSMDVGDVLAVMGSRPDRLSEVRPQQRVLRRTVEQNVDVVTFPALDVPMPQMVLSAHFPDPSRILKCPRSCCHPAVHADSRGYYRRRNSWWKCRWTLSLGCGSSSRSLTFPHSVVPMELEVFMVFTQDRAIPFLRNRSLTIQFLVVVLKEVFAVCTQDSSTAFGVADHRVPAATAEQNVDIPVLRGAPHDFHQNLLPAAGSSDLPHTANQCFFSHFSDRESELSADFNPSTQSAHQMAPGSSTVHGSQDECTEIRRQKACVGASGHCAGFVLAEPGHWAQIVAPSLGALRCLRSSSSISWWWLSWSTSSCARPRRRLKCVLFLGLLALFALGQMVHYSPTSCCW